MALTEEQLDAIGATGKNILVSASAGSGKTLVLTKRVLNNILKRKINVNEMLILTFTEASASEMKEKIKRVLKENNQMDQYRLVDSSYISTIDAFFLSIVKRYSYLLGISSNIEITDDIYFKYFYQNLLDKYIEELYNAKDTRLEECIKSGKDKSNRSLKRAVMEISTTLDKRFDKDDFLKNFSGNDSDRVRNLFNKEYDVVRTKLCDLLDQLADTASNSSKHISAISNVREAIINGEEVTLDSIPAKNKDCQAEFIELRPKIKKIVDKEYSIYQKESLNLDDSIKKMNDYSIFVMDIVKELDSRLTKYKKEHNLYSFKDITKLIYKLITGNADVRNELKYSFKEIMLDEFQDTDKIQNEIFEMISNNNLFQVGDVKQSIYEFRDADPSIFLNKYASYQSDPSKGMVIDLTKNFRSRKEVINTVNNVFITADNLGFGGLKYDDKHIMKYGLKDYDLDKPKKHPFEIMTYQLPEDNPLKYKDYEYEAFIVAEDIMSRVGKELVLNETRNSGGPNFRECKYSDFTILSQAGTHFDSIKKIFNYLEIPIKVTKDEDVKEGHYLDVIRNIFKLIYNLNVMKHKNYKSCAKEWDKVKYALTSVLRSYLYEKSDEEIYDIIKNKNLDSEAYSLAKDIASKVDNLSNLEIFNLVNEAYEPLSRNWVYKDINSEMARHEFIYNLAKSSFNFEDFVSMLDYISKGDVTATFKAQDDGENSVLLSTIHHSKGLEYPFVYMIQNKREFNQKEVGAYPVGVVLDDIVIADLASDFTSLIKITEKEKLNNLVYEKIRLLYVEMTRAREKLIMVDEFDDKKIEVSDINSYHDLFKKIYYLSGAACYYPKDPKKLDKAYLAPTVKKATTNLNPAKYLDVRSLYIQEQEPKLTKASSTKFGLMDGNTKALLKQGTSLHQEFEMEDFNNPSSTNPKVKAFYKTSIMQDIKNAKFYKEYEFIDQDGLNGIIDLMIVKDNEIDIVDYKTKNIDSPSYQQQVNIYGNYIKSLNLGKEIKLYLYSIMDETLEEVAWL